MLTRPTPGLEERVKSTQLLQELVKWLPPDLFLTCLSRVSAFVSHHPLRGRLKASGVRPARAFWTHCEGICQEINPQVSYLPSAASGKQKVWRIGRAQMSVSR